ncbi:MAG: hypothetical protein E6860_05095 [Clostridium sp.]|uniref:hypothetical protein n=1 Tax=Clostridium sp. TaxID=1506 RepID=UPI002902FDBC|nr:hypothetical protein [Clostridium sp.]MDU1584907.1 hypothetical protein [Clostridium sp.]MDU1978087.1 hypothetical protein [Clostridium sp.]MDU1993098.1 hypothetical protein [Clostridium sp.]MDU6048182.1 hypothetical protein [Clostridium sp.]MDU6221101.1 hypothetical protein [Clostridium sp.]
MNLDLLKEEIYSLLSNYNTYANCLPLKDEEGKDLDYLNNIYVTYKLLEIRDMVYKNEIPLEIQVISNKINKDKIDKISIEIDQILNKKVLTKARVVRQNVWLVPFFDIEEENEYITLQYYISMF